MPAAENLVAFARRNQTLTIVIAGAGVMTAYLALRGRSPAPAMPAPAPAPVPSPAAPSDGGGGAPGIDLSALAALFASAQQGGADTGASLGQAGLAAGVGLGSSGLQAGVDLGSAGLAVGGQLGLGGLGLASDVTGYLGSALETSVIAQSGQTTLVTGTLADLLKSLIPKGSLVPGGKSGSTGGSRGAVVGTRIGARPTSSYKVVPGTKTPAGGPKLRTMQKPAKSVAKPGEWRSTPPRPIAGARAI